MKTINDFHYFLIGLGFFVFKTTLTNKCGETYSIESSPYRGCQYIYTCKNDPIKESINPKSAIIGLSPDGIYSRIMDPTDDTLLFWSTVCLELDEDRKVYMDELSTRWKRKENSLSEIALNLLLDINIKNMDTGLTGGQTICDHLLAEVKTLFIWVTVSIFSSL